MFCDIADDFAIVINSETGIYYGINSFGTSVLDNLIQGSAIAAILAELQKIPGVPADIEQGLTVFIDELKEKEIIVPGLTVKNKININAELALTDKFIFTISENTDAKEFLSVVPFYCVKEHWIVN
jgi:hypothetical protein